MEADWRATGIETPQGTLAKNMQPAVKLVNSSHLSSCSKGRTVKTDTMDWGEQGYTSISSLGAQQDTRESS